MKPILAAFCVLIFFITGCQKTIEPYTGGGATDSSYFPLSANSYWKYHDSEYISQVTTETSLGVQIDYNGKKYNKFLLAQSSSADTAYFTRQGAEYYNYQYETVSGAVIQLETLFLNDTASVGYTWQQDAGTVNGFAARNNGIIMEKNITVDVEGKTYNQVIHTQLELQYNLGGVYQTYATYDYFIAKGVGIIKISSNLEFSGSSIKTASNLFDYSIR